MPQTVRGLYYCQQYSGCRNRQKQRISFQIEEPGQYYQVTILSFRATEAELEESISKKEGLKKEHFELIADNRALNEEIDGCLSTIIDYERMNAELQKEVENYIDTDEHARNLLNRKDVMRSLLEQVNNRLDKTSGQIEHLRH